MKKAISILAACMLVFSFAGMASAQDLPFPPAGECAAPGTIDRGCEPTPEQGSCATSPFDYEDYGDECAGSDGYSGSYCDDADKGDYHRAFIPVCDCIANVTDFDEPEAGDVYDIGMEIMIDKGDGELVSMTDEDNGVYFAENFTSIPMEALSDEDCTDDLGCSPANSFVGDFVYTDADGDSYTTPNMNTGSACDIADEEKIVAFEPDPDMPERDTWSWNGTDAAPFGYTVTSDDVQNGRSTWWVDIPALRTDSTVTEAGWKVYVKVSIQEAEETSGGGLCSDCPKCEYLVEIGTLCCDTPAETCEDTLIYPYFPKTANFWYGMAITNVGSEDGTASITMYENDGDIASGDVDVPANSSVVFGHQDVFDELTMDASPDGTLGNSQSYFRVVTDFPASGFGMTADNGDGSNSMGYLPVRPDCSDCTQCR